MSPKTVRATQEDPSTKSTRKVALVAPLALATALLAATAGACGGSSEPGSATGGSPGATGGSATGGRAATGGAAATGGTTSGTGGLASGGGAAAAGRGGGSATGGVTGAIGGAGQAGGIAAGGGRSATGGQGGRVATGGSAPGGASGGGATGSCGPLVAATRPIAFGTLLDAAAVTCTAQQLAASLVNPSGAQWRAKGDQHRTYNFAAAKTTEPYRIYVPTNWDGKASLPLALFLHGSGSDENGYIDMNNKQLITLAQQHGYLLVSPLGDKGAYGNFLRLTAPFGNQPAADNLLAQVTADSERTNELSEEDVINVLELVLAEYPVDRSAMFLFGHSMGSGGTWYLGGKYPGYWRGIAPMSGPFVQKTGYPWDAVHKLQVFVTEGTQAPSVDASHLLRDWLAQNAFDASYKEVNADHGGMIPLVLPDVFDFFDKSRAH